MGQDQREQQLTSSSPSGPLQRTGQGSGCCPSQTPASAVLRMALKRRPSVCSWWERLSGWLAAHSVQQRSMLLETFIYSLDLMTLLIHVQCGNYFHGTCAILLQSCRRWKTGFLNTYKESTAPLQLWRRAVPHRVTSGRARCHASCPGQVLGLVLGSAK